jgi:hypothetical protein
MCAYKEQYSAARQQILPTIFPFLGVNPSGGTVLEIFSEKKRNGRMKRENVRRLKGTKLDVFGWSK